MQHLYSDEPRQRGSCSIGRPTGGLHQAGQRAADATDCSKASILSKLKAPPTIEPYLIHCGAQGLLNLDPGSVKITGLGPRLWRVVAKAYLVKPPEVDPGDQMRYFSWSDACPQLFEPDTDITKVALQ